MESKGKGPEELLAELREVTQPYCASGCGCYEDGSGIPAHDGQCVTKCNTLEEQEAWLRSSLSSLLRWGATQMPEKKGAVCHECDGYDDGIDDCKATLLRLADEICKK